MTSANRQRIIDAASQLFIEGAFYNADVVEICRLAGVNKGTLYHFFNSKSDVLIAAIEDRTDALVARFKDVAKTNADPLTRLHGFFKLAKQYSIECRHKKGSCPGCLLGTLSTEHSGTELAVRQTLQDAMRRLLDIVEDTIEDYCKAHNSSADTRKAAFALLSMLQGAHLMARLNDDVSNFDVLETSMEGILMSYSHAHPVYGPSLQTESVS